VSNREKYATYHRDQSTNLDYAMNRYYGWQHGRFLTPDPYKASAGLTDPGSWNRYAYVLDACAADVGMPCFSTTVTAPAPGWWPGSWFGGGGDGRFDRPEVYAMMPAFWPGEMVGGGSTGFRRVDRDTVAGYRVAMDALDSQECAEAVGAVNGEDAKMRFRNAEILVDPSLPAPTTVLIGKDTARLEYQPAWTNGNDIFVNGNLFFAPDSTIFPSTRVSVLAAMMQEYGLRTLTPAQAQAIWLTHELGHLTSAFGNDTDNVTLSRHYTTTVIQKCFPLLL